MKIKIKCHNCDRPFIVDIDDNYKTYPVNTTLAIIQCFKCKKLTKLIYIGKGNAITKKATKRDLLKFFKDCEKENKEEKCIS